ncbi:GNAT family N-acetyltransferase [Actinomarinicola tropica]|uniref:GNAT family N-acetyltransferase n=1 Tax=Actinomarinicola tropica TaxID=2789776 RepID=A0A5Q2RMW5_9ACTN|nr:GNAT family N-acetyltransferase [Actinomarinicola tropica]QGG95746.1 GNAT family N-acetyltransferase [Actinomarinicola tropica]
MTFPLRPITDEELPQLFHALQDPFGFHSDGDDVEDFRLTTELDRTLAAFDDEEMVGTAGAYSFELTVPGNLLVDAAGITIVTVSATHRRRGILRSMMERQLDDVAERGETIAILTASEASIYGRFGYGLASQSSSWTLETDRATLARPSTATGRLRLVDADRFLEAGPQVYDRRRREIPGAVNRVQAWWDVWQKDRPHTRGGQSARWYVLHEDDAGEVDGMLAYRRNRDAEHGLSRNVLTVDQLYGADDEVEAALWSFLLDHDLIHSVAAHGRPVDEPLRWRLADPRRLVTTDVVDDLWLRLVDVCGALSARRYGTTDRLVVEVADPFRPHTAGRYLLDGGPDGAACTRTDADPDLTMDVADLGALYLGGVTATALHRAGRIEEPTPGAVRRADVFFASSPPPWMTTGF